MLGVASLTTVSCFWGMGRHVDSLTPEQISNAIKWNMISQMVMIQVFGFGKIAVIAFLIRIQEGIQSTRKTLLTAVLYFIAVSNIVLNITQLVLMLLGCTPYQKLWNSDLPGKCVHLARARNVGYFQNSKLTLARHQILGSLLTTVFRLVLFQQSRSGIVSHSFTLGCEHFSKNKGWIMCPNGGWCSVCLQWSIFTSYSRR